MRNLRLVWGGGLLATVLLLLGAGPASAHVLLDKAAPHGDGSVTLTFTFDHGCDESPTTLLAVTLPAGATALEAKGPSGWTSEVTDGRVTWSGPGVRANAEGVFTMRATLVGTVGESLYFPTLQQCENGGSYQWDDRSSTAPEPAPSLVATSSVLAARSVAPPPVGTGGASLRTALALVAGAAVVAGVGARVATMRRP